MDKKTSPVYPARKIAWKKSEALPPRMQGRIRCDFNFMGRGIYYVIETKWDYEDDNSWSVDTAYKIGDDDRVSYEIVHKIKDYIVNGIDIDFRCI